MVIRSEVKSESRNAPPVHKEKLGAVEAAVWENEVGTEGRTRFRVTLSKSYKKDDKWERTASLDADDLPYAIKVLDRCHTWAAEHRYSRAKGTEQTHEQEEDAEQEYGR